MAWMKRVLDMRSWRLLSIEVVVIAPVLVLMLREMAWLKYALWM
jgi:hypothetical protein